MSRVVIQFNTSSIALVSDDDVPRCDMTVIQIRHTYAPSSYSLAENPYVDASHEGAVYTEYSNYLQYVDSDKHIRYRRLAVLGIIHVTSLSKGSIAFNTSLTGTSTTKTVTLDQTPIVVIRINHTDVIKFVGNPMSKDQFVNRVASAYFSESKMVLYTDPFV